MSVMAMITAIGAAGRGSSFATRLAPGLRALLRADLGIALGATPRATGTAPPVVTFSGTLTIPYGIRVEIQTTGARGAATFRYSHDNGTTWIESGVTTAATYAMIGPLAGTVLNFPVGSYTNNNVYRATVAAWADLSGIGNHLAQPTAANQPVMITRSAVLGKAALSYDGTALWLFRDPLVGVLAQPYTVAAAWNLTDNSGTRRLYDGNAGGREQCFTGVNNYVIGAGANLAVTVTPNTGGHASVGVYNGASGTVTVDRSNTATGAVSTASAGALYIGSDFTGGANWFGEIAEVDLYAGAMSAVYQSRIQAYMKSFYSTP